MIIPNRPKASKRHPERELAGKGTDARSAWKQILESLRNNPIVSLWNAILICGGAILLLYHAHINYLPDFALSDLAGLLASVAVIGIFLVTLLALSCLVPAYVLSSFDRESSGQNPLQRVFSGRRDNALLVLFPGVSWGIFLSVPLFFEQFAKRYKAHYVPSGFFLVALAAGVICLIVKPRGDASGDMPFPEAFDRTIWLRRSVSLFLWSGLFVTLLSVGSVLAAAGEKEKAWVGLLAATLLLGGINLAAYFSRSRRWWPPLGVGCLLIILGLPMFVGRPFLWPDVIVQTLALGNRNAVEVVVSYKQCQALAKFGAQCGSAASESSQISLSNVNILSRVGTSVLLELMVDSSGADTSSGPKQHGGAAGWQALVSHEFDRFCPGSGTGHNRSACTSCDQLTLEKSASPSPLTYKANLICVVMAIPKDQVASISWLGTRQYSGFTSYSMPQDSSPEKK